MNSVRSGFAGAWSNRGETLRRLLICGGSRGTSSSQKSAALPHMGTHTFHRGARKKPGCWSNRRNSGNSGTAMSAASPSKSRTWKTGELRSAASHRCHAPCVIFSMKNGFFAWVGDRRRGRDGWERGGGGMRGAPLSRGRCFILGVVVTRFAAIGYGDSVLRVMWSNHCVSKFADFVEFPYRQGSAVPILREESPALFGLSEVLWQFALKIGSSAIPWGRVGTIGAE